jgi:Holliday junction resolvase
MNRRGHKGKVDRTHGEILAGLRKAGIVAYSIAPVGEGLPDIIAARAGQTWLLEVKVGRAKLTADEERFKVSWPGRYAMVRTVQEALAVVLGRS